MLDEEEKSAALSDKKKCMWSLFTYLSPQFFFPYTVNSIQFISLSKKSITRCKPHGYRNREYIYIYKVIQIIVEYIVSQLG